MSASRIIGTFIVAAVFLMMLTPMFNYFLTTVINQYLVSNILPDSAVQQSWNAAVRACESLKPANVTASCSEILSNYSQMGVDFTAQGYMLSDSPFIPYPSEWFSGQLTGEYIGAVVILSLIFSAIAEAGGRSL